MKNTGDLMSTLFVAFFTIVLVTGMICTGNKMAITREIMAKLKTGKGGQQLIDSQPKNTRQGQGTEKVCCFQS